MVDDKQNFVTDVFRGMALQATLQRCPTYNRNVSDKRKEQFRGDLRKALEDLASEYTAPVSEERHLTNIQGLSNKLSKLYSDCLSGGRFRIGSAQKALNVYLKALWCNGNIPTPPPHCPFDQIIILKLPAESRVNWTELDSMEGYRLLVDAAKKIAKDKPLAEWELDEYRRPNPARGRVKSPGLGKTSLAFGL